MAAATTLEKIQSQRDWDSLFCALHTYVRSPVGVDSALHRAQTKGAGPQRKRLTMAGRMKLQNDLFRGIQSGITTQGEITANIAFDSGDVARRETNMQKEQSRKRSYPVTR